MAVANYLSAEAAAAKPANYLMDEIKERVGKGPVKMHIVVQLAEAGDVVDNSTVHWPCESLAAGIRHHLAYDSDA